MNHRSRCIAVLAMALVLAAAVSPAGAATEVKIQFVQNGTALSGAAVTLFFSNSAVSARADESGVARFTVESGKGFWIEVNRARLARFYQIDDVPSRIDVAQVGTIEWKGGR